jgi:hypothetical protein
MLMLPCFQDHVPLDPGSDFPFLNHRRMASSHKDASAVYRYPVHCEDIGNQSDLRVVIVVRP